MPITATDLKFFLSGGAGNSDPNASLGGIKSATEIVDATLENLFANANGAEAAAGSTKYRCYYVENDHATIQWDSVVQYILTNTPDPDTNSEIGLDPAGIDGVAVTIADEDTAPVGVVFSEPSVGSPLAVGNVPAQSFYSVWVKRIINPASAAFNNDGGVYQSDGDTGA